MGPAHFGSPAGIGWINGAQRKLGSDIETFLPRGILTGCRVSNALCTMIAISYNVANKEINSCRKNSRALSVSELPQYFEKCLIEQQEWPAAARRPRQTTNIAIGLRHAQATKKWIVSVDGPFVFYRWSDSAGAVRQAGQESFE